MKRGGPCQPSTKQKTLKFRENIGFGFFFFFFFFEHALRLLHELRTRKNNILPTIQNNKMESSRKTGEREEGFVTLNFSQ